MNTKKNEYIELGPLANLQSASKGLFLRLNGLLIALHVVIAIIYVAIMHVEMTGAQWFMLCYIFLYIAVYRGASFKLSNHALLTVIFVEVAFIGFHEGGITNEFAASIVLIPLLSALLLGRIAGWLSLIFCSSLTLLLCYQFSPAYDNSGSPEKSALLSPLILISIMYVLEQVGMHYYTQLSEMVHKLWTEANIDHMTNLNNRRGIDAALEKELLRAKRNNSWVSVCVIDIDHFKRYNDINGHQKGDDCLKFIAKQIDLALRRPPDLSARLGGEEFLIVLPETDVQGALHVAESLRKNIEQLKLKYHSQKSDVVTVSIGITSLNDEDLNSANADDLIELADKALYEAKENGRNRVVVANTKNITKPNTNKATLETI